MRCHAEPLHLQQPLLVDDTSIGISHTCTRSEQLRERISEPQRHLHELETALRATLRAQCFVNIDHLIIATGVVVRR
jgi:hypothetical protein